MKELQMELKPNKIFIIFSIIILFMIIFGGVVGLISLLVMMNNVLPSSKSILASSDLFIIILSVIGILIFVFVFGKMIMTLIVGRWTAYKITISLADEVFFTQKGKKEFKVCNNENTCICAFRPEIWIICGFDKPVIKIFRICRVDWRLKQFELLQTHLKMYRGYIDNMPKVKIKFSEYGIQWPSCLGWVIREVPNEKYTLAK